MKVTRGQIFLVAGSLFVSIGFLVPSPNHPNVNLIDVIPILLMWCFSLADFRYHQDIFSKGTILYIVMPVLVIGFVLLLLSLNYLLSFGRDFQLYLILLGWAFFNTGLYYNTMDVLKKAPKR